MSYRLLTVSRMRSFRACRRMHHYRYELGLRPVREEEGALHFGSAVHLALEHWWKATGEGDYSGALQRALDALEGQMDSVYELARARAMMAAYHERWRRHQADFEVLGVEVEFWTDVLNPENLFDEHGRVTDKRLGVSRTWRHAGKIDAIVRINGDVWIVEHKTTSENIADQAAEYWSRLLMDQQVSLYFLGAESVPELNERVAGCLYDVLRKPGERPGTVPLLDEHGVKIVLDEHGNRVLTKAGKPRQSGDKKLGYTLQKRDETPAEFEARCAKSIAEDPTAYLERRPVERTETQIIEFWWDAWHQGVTMRDVANSATKHGTKAVTRNPEACFKWGRRCPYWEACATGIDPEERPDLFEKTPLHTELSGETVALATGGNDHAEGNDEARTDTETA